MIYSLRIKNIALIDEANIEFNDGLNVLSGETGAGKSIIVDSMNLILGERAARELIKSGTDRAEVEAVLYVDAEKKTDFFEENGIDDSDDSVIISRRISLDGKNICRINGCAVSLSVLKSFMENIVDLHGQHEHQALLYAKNHMRFIDNFAGDVYSNIKNDIKEKLSEYFYIKNELNSIGGSKEDIQKQIRLLDYEIDEITKADIRVGEEDELKQELSLVLNAEKIKSSLNNGYDALYAGQQSALSLISSCMREIESISEHSEEYKNIYNVVSDSYYALDDAAHSIKAECDSVDFDQQRIDEIQIRLELISDLKRKYGQSEQAVIDYLNDAQNRIEKFINSDDLLKELENKKLECEKELFELHHKLLSCRKQASEELEKCIEKELSDLGMKGCSFSVRFDDIPEFDACDFSKKELFGAEFYISTNVGEEEKPLSRTASGGEISRIMLAFKNVFAVSDDIETLIFDEIDTGISGNMATVVAKKMASIAKHKQVICVTHLPQIASFADANYLIRKEVACDKTYTRINILDAAGKVNEIVRLSGGGGESAVAHAKDMIIYADAEKSKLA